MKVIYLILFICSGACFCQTKKEYIVDENNNSISDTLFLDKLKVYEDGSKKYFHKFFENDTASFGKLMLYKEVGDLNQATILSIVGYIENTSGKKIDKNKTLVINYYYEPKKINRQCMRGGLKDKVYVDFFKNNEDFFEIAFAHVDDYKNIRNLYKDKNNVIRDTLFPDFQTCGNYIIIRPNGHFFRRYGEHRRDKIPEKAVATW